MVVSIQGKLDDYVENYVVVKLNPTDGKAKNHQKSVNCVNSTTWLIVLGKDVAHVDEESTSFSIPRQLTNTSNKAT